MNWKTLAATAALLAGIAGAQAANAGTVVLSDNFDNDAPVVLNWPGDATFLSIPQPGNVGGMPSVDLVGTADGFGNLAFSGNSVDLDGSTGTGFTPAGEIQSIASLPTGNYTVSFELAGNLRGAPVQITEVSIGSQTVDFMPANNQGYQLVTASFTGASGQVAFTDLGPATQQGDLIDNIVVSSVPEPATWAVMLVGFGGLGVAMRSRRKQAAATA
jgi:hypothetical protein